MQQGSDSEGGKRAYGKNKVSFYSYKNPGHRNLVRHHTINDISI
jgi:hypothetical protein